MASRTWNIFAIQNSGFAVFSSFFEGGVNLPISGISYVDDGKTLIC